MIEVGTIFLPKKFIILESCNVKISYASILLTLNQFEIIRIATDPQYGLNPLYSKFYYFKEIQPNKNNTGFVRYTNNKLNAIRVDTSANHVYWHFFNSGTFDNYFQIKNHVQIFENTEDVKDNCNLTHCYICKSPTKILDTGTPRIMRYCPRCKV